MRRRSATGSVRHDSTAVTAVPAGAPTWVTPELIAKTLKTWQPYYAEPLTPEDALVMILRVSSLFDLLSRPR